MNRQNRPFLREIKGTEMKKWNPTKQSIALGIIEGFLDSDMEMAEVDLSVMPEPETKMGSKIKSSRVDSFASSFYAWKKKKPIEEKLKRLEIDVLLIRRGERAALKKVKKV